MGEGDHEVVEGAVGPSAAFATVSLPFMGRDRPRSGQGGEPTFQPGPARAYLPRKAAGGGEARPIAATQSVSDRSGGAIGATNARSASEGPRPPKPAPAG
jgi:hypothetical protein